MASLTRPGVGRVAPPGGARSVWPAARPPVIRTYEGAPGGGGGAWARMCKRGLVGRARPSLEAELSSDTRPRWRGPVPPMVNRMAIFVVAPPCSRSSAAARRRRALCLAAALTAPTWACSQAKELEEVKAELTRVNASEAALRREVESLKTRPPPSPAPAAPRGPDPTKVYSVPVDGAPMRGPADAWVTVVEFADFQCKFCGDVAATLGEVERTFGRAVRLVYRHNPLSFHARAWPAAKAAVCAQAQNKFWPLHDKLFANTQALGARDPQSLGRGAGMSDADLEGLAKAAGARVEAFKACLADPATKARIDEDQALALRLGARGTPAFFVNGRFLGGAQPFAKFKALIDEELARAKASGTPRADYYARAVVAAGEKAM